MLKVLEALIAIVSILVAFIIVYRSVSLPDIETVNWRNYGFLALQTLDNDGLLANYVINSNNTLLNSSLAPLMPTGVLYDTLICDNSCAGLNISATKVTSISYYVAGNITNFAPKKILLYMWSS